MSYFLHDHLQQQLVYENGLGRDCQDLHHPVDDVHGAGDGGVDVEDPHGDRQRAVDEDEEHAEVEQEQVHTVLSSRRPVLGAQTFTMKQFKQL